MRRLLPPLSAAVLALTACGSVRTPSTVERPAGGVVDEAAGVQLLLLPRATDGRVWLSLWIDAGARDADPPQLATVAAWSADPRARVLADATEISRTCRREELAGCLDGLARAIHLREVSDEALGAALQQLRVTRRRAQADPRRASDALAIRALLGEDADPLGAHEADERVDRAAVQRFLEAHFGSGRVLLVAVGDLDRGAFRSAAERAFGALPSASAQRRPASVLHRAVEVEVGDRGWVSVATMLEDHESANEAARRWVVRVGHASASADVFPLRGGSVLLTRASGIPPPLLVQRTTEVLEEAPDGPAPLPDTPLELARWHGASWAAGGSSIEGGLGLGVLIDGGRGDALDEEDPDATRRDEVRQELSEALSEELDFEGSLRQEAAELTLRNGARLVARRMEGAAGVGAVVTFEGGAREESPREHGITALLAALTARACTDRAARELGGGLGVRVEPFVTPARWGFSLSGPRERWAEISYLAGRCARVEVSPQRVESVRTTLHTERGQALAGLAGVTGAGLPGRFTPLPGGLVTATPRELRRWSRRVAVGARALIVFVGDPIEAAVRRIARNAERWPRGESAEPSEWNAPDEALGAFTAEGPLRAWILWTAEDDAESPHASAAFGHAMRSALASHPGVRPTQLAFGAADGRSWVALLVAVDEGTLQTLPAHVRATVSEIDAAAVATRASADDEERRASAAVSPLGLARELARGEPPSAEVARALVERLRRAPPRFVVLRPPPGS